MKELRDGEGRRVICLNRSPAYNDDTFQCSLMGCLVSWQCCQECVTKKEVRHE
jgi:hypothetical protein